MNTTKILAFRKPLLLIVWLLAMQGAAFAQNLRETFFSPNGKIEWKAEGEFKVDTSNDFPNRLGRHRK